MHSGIAILCNEIIFLVLFFLVWLSDCEICKSPTHLVIFRLHFTLDLRSLYQLVQQKRYCCGRRLRLIQIENNAILLGVTDSLQLPKQLHDVCINSICVYIIFGCLQRYNHQCKNCILCGWPITKIKALFPITRLQIISPRNSKTSNPRFVQSVNVAHQIAAHWRSVGRYVQFFGRCTIRMWAMTSVIVQSECEH